MPGNKRWKKEWTQTRNAKRKAQRWKELSILAEGTTEINGAVVRTLTILRDGKPMELLSGADVRRALDLALTRIHDWGAMKAIPPTITVGRVRYFTANQISLLRKLAERNDHCANAAQLAERHAVIRQVWQRWND